jgi:hypothetical protein
MGEAKCAASCRIHDLLRKITSLEQRVEEGDQQARLEYNYHVAVLTELLRLEGKAPHQELSERHL